MLTSSNGHSGISVSPDRPHENEKTQQLKELKRTLEQTHLKLLAAAKMGKVDEVSSILDCPPEVSLQGYFDEELKNLMNVIGNEGWNAFHYACYYGQEDVVDLLLERGADVNRESTEGWIPLHLAVLKGQKSVFTKLLKQKQLDVNQLTRKGTAIAIAS